MFLINHMRKVNLIGLLILFIFLLLIENLSSQTFNKPLKTPYKIKVIDFQKKENKNGILYKVTDSSLVIITEIDYYKFKNNIDFQKTVIPFSNIDKIKISKKNHFWRAFGITTLAGAGIGALSGYFGGDDHPTNGVVGFTAKEKAVIVGVGGTCIGALAGTVIGLAQINIPINRKYIEFSRRKESLIRKAISN